MKKVIFFLLLTASICLEKTSKAAIIPGCAKVTWTSPTTGVLRCLQACEFCARTFYENGVWWIEINWPKHQIVANLDDTIDQNGDSLDENQLNENPSIFHEATFSIGN